MTKVLVVEDDANVRLPLVDQLQREGYEFISAATGHESERGLNENPDLIIVDWMLPDTQGIELLKRWRGQGILTPAIMLTARTDLIDKVLGLELGANDYMTKPFEVRELIARIRAQLRNRLAKNQSGPSDLLCLGRILLNSGTREVQYNGLLVELTKTEFDLLKVFLESPNQVFSREELLKKVWGYNNYPTTRTVDTHILQLRQKFSEDNFETVHGIGYRFRFKK